MMLSFHTSNPNQRTIRLISLLIFCVEFLTISAAEGAYVSFNAPHETLEEAREYPV